MDIVPLKQAGLTDGEVKVYLSLLELGSSTTGPIIDHSGIARSIIYQILEKLAKKGLVSHITQDKTKYYQAANPSRILDYLEKQHNDLQKNREQIQQILPELLLKQTLTAQSEARFYSGIKGIQTAHEGTYRKLGKGEEYVYLGVPSFQPEHMHRYWKRDHVRRMKAGITCKLLFNKGTSPELLKDRNSYKGCDSRLNTSDIDTTAGFLIYKDTTVIILQHPQELAVEIVNQDVANSFMEYFKEFWKKSKKVNSTQRRV